jgi:hypothetical protein
MLLIALRTPETPRGKTLYQSLPARQTPPSSTSASCLLIGTSSENFGQPASKSGKIIAPRHKIKPRRNPNRRFIGAAAYIGGILLPIGRDRGRLRRAVVDQNSRPQPTEPVYLTWGCVREAYVPGSLVQTVSGNGWCTILRLDRPLSRGSTDVAAEIEAADNEEPKSE